MKAYTKEITDKLNAILIKTYDAEKGFGKAAENSEAKSLIAWFTDRSLDRHRFGIQLKSELGPYGVDFADHSSVAGSLHRAWMDVKTFFSKDNDEAMLEEAIRGEKAALDEYSEVLEDRKLPPSAYALLTSQKAHIEYGLSLLEKTRGLEFERN